MLLFVPSDVSSDPDLVNRKVPVVLGPVNVELIVGVVVRMLW